MELLIHSFKLVRHFINHPVREYKNYFLTNKLTKRLAEYFERMDCENTMLITFSPNGKTVVRKALTGHHSFWDNIKVSGNKVIQIREKGIYLFPITFADAVKDNELVSVGYLGFSRKKRLSEQEFEAVETLVSVMGSFFYQRLQETYRISAQIFRDILNNYNFVGKLPGTIVNKWIFNLYKTFDALSVFYISLNEKEYIIEYFKRDSDSNFINNKKSIAYLDKFLQDKILLHKLNDFMVKVVHCNGLLQSLRRYDNCINSSSTLYINVIYEGGEPIACWVFAYSQNQAIPLYAIRDNLAALNKKIGNNFKFLYQRRTGKMIVSPIFKSRDTQIKEDLVFVLMPFTLSWSKRIYEKILKPTIESIEGLNVKRADDLYGADIMEDIWESILSARVIIADISERNPNVFYELGICHTLGKEVILLTQKVSDIPFDLNRYRHIVYEDNLDGYDILKRQLVGAVATVINKR